MCIPSFHDFIAMNPIYKAYADSQTAQEIYAYLSQLETIDKMIAANNNGRPALYGAQAHIEQYFADRPDFSLSERRVKQCVGTMVRTILEPLGYVPSGQRDLPRAESRYFTSARHYEFDADKARCKLVRRLELEPVQK